MVDTPVDLSQRRWDAKPEPSAHAPVEALRAILRDVESGEIDMRHVVIAYARKPDDKDESGVSGYYQAGDLGYFGAMGLLSRVQQLMGEG